MADRRDGAFAGPAMSAAERHRFQRKRAALAAAPPTAAPDGVRVAMNLRLPPQPGSAPKGDRGGWRTPTASAA